MTSTFLPAVKVSRRTWLKSAAAMAGLAATSARAFGAEVESEALVPIRAITRGPKCHWFGYYDKLEFDPTNRYVLSNEVDFEHRTPTAADRIAVGMVDTQDGDKWIPLGTSDAWGWQQGCMLQWRPGTPSEVLWNDREDGRFVCHVLDVQTGAKRTLPKPVYTVSPDGKWAVTADFARIQAMRPGYGYQGIPDAFADQKAPQDSGIWRVNLETGDSQLIVSLAEIVKIPFGGRTLEQNWNWFNHLLINPDGTRFIFLHRWRADAGTAESRARTGFVTRLFTANLDGSDLHVLDPSGNTSHFIWRDPKHVCAWTKPEGRKAAFYLFEDQTSNVEIVGDGLMPINGHNTYLPIGNGAEWILNDTYPDRTRRQTPYLVHLPSGRRVDLGHFYLPPEYQGEWRCDLHPRCSRDGHTVAIDSPHGGQGRQVWLLDIRQIVG
jgi:hypothetical protein